jgi:outer membrane protein assembly factor BamB
MNNKNGNLFIWNRSKIGAGVIARFGIGDSEDAFIAQPSWNPVTQTMYDSHAVVRKNGEAVGAGIAAIAVTRGCTFKQAWLTRTGTGEQLPPLIVGNTVYDGAGGSPGIVALNARTGKVMWTWGTTGTASISTPMIEADGLIIAGDNTGALRAFD